MVPNGTDCHISYTRMLMRVKGLVPGMALVCSFVLTKSLMTNSHMRSFMATLRVEKKANICINWRTRTIYAIFKQYKIMILSPFLNFKHLYFSEQDEIANTVAFLLSDYASMINGVVLPVDGGHIIHMALNPVKK